MNDRRRAVAIGLAATAGWPLAMSGWLADDFYVPLSVLTTGLAVAVVLAFRSRLRMWFAPQARLVAVGLVAGAVQAAATHVAYAYVGPLLPAMKEQVLSLYSVMETGIGPVVALPIIVTTIIVEEMVWRGALLEGSNDRVAKWAALSVVLYAIAQLGLGSWALALTALACDVVWTAMRHITGSLTAPVVMHLVWSLSVLVFVPLEGSPPWR